MRHASWSRYFGPEYCVHDTLELDLYVLGKHFLAQDCPQLRIAQRWHALQRPRFCSIAVGAKRKKRNARAQRPRVPCPALVPTVACTHLDVRIYERTE